ncbi:46 kDa FK506-binding nuclear protein-like [Trichoplusia ni]|uniref:FK506-binding protein n=1 Tax=Trichoplusia ni TaxID=7111 RepID=A0A7E5WWH6_TRINI|nr:46 kDa FK506-binding nuclear protein-like [Trichoplusia ni]
MFWGLIMEPNKRYTQVVEKPFHISQAAMDISTGDTDPCQVMVVVDGKNFLVCTLQKGRIIQVPLDLYFKTGDNVSFLTNGKCNVHLTGYLDPEYEDELEEEEDDEDEDEEIEEDEEPPAPKNKRKLENSNDVAANKKAKSEKKAGKKAAAASSEDDDDDDDDQLQKFLDGEDIDTDENDDSFKINTTAEDDSDEDEEEDDDDEDDEDEEEEETPKKKKKAASSESADTTLDTSKEEEVDVSKLTKSQKRRLKKKLQQQAKQPQVNGVAKKDEAQKAEAPQKAEKKKPEAKQEEEKREKKQLTGGVAIEDLKVGTGLAVKPGKVVTVYYEGRLKQNNKMFDNCVKGPGFKFRLGAKEVISGWDVGIAGMKVGGKRKIICPPAMAYGAKGSPPVIPPNSTLVFEVELKNIK